MTWPDAMEGIPYSVEFLQSQHQSWLSLAIALERAQGALLSGNVAEFENWTNEQRRSCEQLVAFKSLAEACARLPLSGESLEIYKQIEELRSKVWRLKQVQAALLRRASRWLRILRNQLDSNNVAYTPAASLLTPPALDGGR